MKRMTVMALVAVAVVSFVGGPVWAADRASSLEERLEKVEKALGDNPVASAWPGNLSISGAVEIEAGATSMDSAGVDTDESDVDLAKVEVGLEAKVAKYVTGEVIFLYEDNDVNVDEGFITLGAEEDMPFYFKAGKFVVPFGNYESHFVTDPLTLELGETNEGAAVAGFANNFVDISAGAFNGSIDEDGDDDTINSFVAAVSFSLPVGSFGASYISNLAASGGLSESVNDMDADGEAGPIQDMVAGYSVFASVGFLEKVFIEAEYVCAADEFQANELAFDGGERFEPKAWNLELAFAATDALEAAVRYEGSEDGGNWIPEIQYGAVVSYGIFDNTAVAVEYLHGEFENDDERDAFVAQLAIEF